LTILVTGATGNVGRLVVDRLLAMGATGVRALTNDPEKAALPAEVEVVEGYIGRPQTVPAALGGVERMYLAPLPETAREVAGMAKEADVERIVDLAGRGWWRRVEEAVEESGVAWTHLRPGEFMNNSLIWAPQIRTTRTVRDAYPGAANAPIDLDDIAAVAAVALLEGGHLGKAYELTGPEKVTRAEQVRLIGEALGEEIPFVELTREQAVEELTPVMGEYASWYLDGKAELVEDPQEPIPTVEDVTGRQATTFAEWAIRHVEDFR
jgi:uncharacterized protein YbjT (DUF2867 family)